MVSQGITHRDTLLELDFIFSLTLSVGSVTMRAHYFIMVQLN